MYVYFSVYVSKIKFFVIISAFREIISQDYFSLREALTSLRYLHVISSVSVKRRRILTSFMKREGGW